MARRNQNTFLKRKKEMERVRKAKEKMDRRQGKKPEEREEPVWGALSAAFAQSQEGASEESSEDQEKTSEDSGEATADTSSET